MSAQELLEQLRVLQAQGVDLAHVSVEVRHPVELEFPLEGGAEYFASSQLVVLR